MSKDDTGYRVIEPGSCTWCGHKPHASACPHKIRTRDPMPHGRDVDTACPCPRRHDNHT